MGSVLPIFRRALAESWRGLVAWTLGIVAVMALYLPLFPSIAASGELERILASLPAQLVDTLGYSQITSGAGYTQATFYGLIGFLLAVMAATGWGSSAIAGAEETGRLELTLAHGVGRVQYALESTLAVLARLLWLGLVAATVALALNDAGDLGLTVEGVLAETAAYVGIAFLSAALSLAVGAATGRRAYALAAGAGIAILGYVLNAIANQVTDAEGLHAVSPYAWAYEQTPLLDGADWRGLALLWSLAALFVLGAVLALRRRDITG